MWRIPWRFLVAMTVAAGSPPGWDFVAPAAAAGAEAAGSRAMPLDRAKALALDAPDEGTRREAVMALGDRGTMAEVPVLVRALRDADEDVRVLAEDALWAVFLRSGDAEVDRLTQEGIRRMQRGDLAEAAALFSQVIARAPKFAEGYNKRATAYYLMGRHADSVADCERTLALNSWHFGALSGEGLNYVALGQPRRALEFFERALAVHPHLEGARRNAELLRKYLATLERRSL
jgi:tetratricopeptide (TPR) repeat protein